MREYVMSVKGLTKYEMRRQDQIQARQTEAKTGWVKTKTKVCMVCDNKFYTDDYANLACSIDCHKELRRGIMV